VIAADLDDVSGSGRPGWFNVPVWILLLQTRAQRRMLQVSRREIPAGGLD
jgi:hypothetical protein